MIIILIILDFIITFLDRFVFLGQMHDVGNNSPKY